MAWHKSHLKVLPYVVRIETQDGSGTGFLFGYNKTKTVAAIATTAHVVDSANDWKQPIKITRHETGQDVFLLDSERIILLDAGRDAASILISTKSLNLPTTLLPLMDSTHHKRVGVELAWMGYPSVAHPELCFFTGRVSAFVEKEDCYLIDGVAINGVSGGPVFDGFDEDAPELVGLISAYIPNRVAGSTLPGLLRAQDITPFQAALQTIRSFEEAKEKEREESKSNESERSTEIPAPPATGA